MAICNVVVSLRRTLITAALLFKSCHDAQCILNSLFLLLLLEL